MSEGNGAAPAAPTNGAPPRNNHGQFSPKDGAVGVVQPEGENGAVPANGKPAGPPAVGWEGWDGSFEVEGKQVKYQSKDEVAKHHRELEWRRKRERAVAEREKQLEQLWQLEPDDFEREYFKLRGIDPQKRFQERVLAEAERQEMSPEQRRMKALETELARRDNIEKQRRQQFEQQQQQQARQQLREHVVADMEAALEVSGLPKTMHTMSLLAEIQEEATAGGGPPLTKEHLAAEANKRFGERGVEPLKKLQGTALLDRLGPDVVRAVLLAERDRRSGTPAQPAPSRSVDTRAPVDAEKTYGEAEASRLLRELRNGGR